MVATAALSNDEIVWHTDLIYRSRPPSGTIFYGVEMPAGAAETAYCNMAHAYSTLPDDLRRAVDGKRARCKYGTLSPLSTFMQRNIDKNFRRETASDEETEAIDRRTPEVVHDLVLENPVTGERHQNLDQARLLRDDLEMLRNKTAGNLDEGEQAKLDEVLQHLSGHLAAIEAN